jgi:hypothetical protein
MMVEAALDAANTRYMVECEKASSFNREYKRFLSKPLVRDVERLCKIVAASADI